MPVYKLPSFLPTPAHWGSTRPLPPLAMHSQPISECIFPLLAPHFQFLLSPAPLLFSFREVIPGWQPDQPWAYNTPFHFLAGKENGYLTVISVLHVWKWRKRGGGWEIHVFPLLVFTDFFPPWIIKEECQSFSEWAQLSSLTTQPQLFHPRI